MLEKSCNFHAKRGGGVFTPRARRACKVLTLFSIFIVVIVLGLVDFMHMRKHGYFKISHVHGDVYLEEKADTTPVFAENDAAHAIIALDANLLSKYHSMRIVGTNENSKGQTFDDSAGSVCTISIDQEKNVDIITLGNLQLQSSVNINDIDGSSAATARISMTNSNFVAMKQLIFDTDSSTRVGASCAVSYKIRLLSGVLGGFFSFSLPTSKLYIQYLDGKTTVTASEKSIDFGPRPNTETLTVKSIRRRNTDLALPELKQVVPELKQLSKTLWESIAPIFPQAELLLTENPIKNTSFASNLMLGNRIGFKVKSGLDTSSLKVPFPMRIHVPAVSMSLMRASDQADEAVPNDGNDGEKGEKSDVGSPKKRKLVSASKNVEFRNGIQNIIDNKNTVYQYFPQLVGVENLRDFLNILVDMESEVGIITTISEFVLTLDPVNDPDSFISSTEKKLNEILEIDFAIEGKEVLGDFANYAKNNFPEDVIDGVKSGWKTDILGGRSLFNTLTALIIDLSDGFTNQKFSLSNLEKETGVKGNFFSKLFDKEYDFKLTVVSFDDRAIATAQHTWIKLLHLSSINNVNDAVKEGGTIVNSFIELAEKYLYAEKALDNVEKAFTWLFFNVFEFAMQREKTRLDCFNFYVNDEKPYDAKCIQPVQLIQDLHREVKIPFYDDVEVMIYELLEGAKKTLLVDEAAELILGICKPGKYNAGGRKCEECKSGFYSTASASDTCDIVPAGSYPTTKKYRTIPPRTMGFTGVFANEDSSMILGWSMTYGPFSISTDSGLTWTAKTQIVKGPYNTLPWRSIIANSDFTTIIGIPRTSYYTTDEIHISLDGGGSWLEMLFPDNSFFTSNTNSLDFRSVYGSKDLSRLILWIVQASSETPGFGLVHLAISMDSGLTWKVTESIERVTTVISMGEPTIRPRCAFTDSFDKIVVITSDLLGLKISVDLGTTWRTVTPTVPIMVPISSSRMSSSADLISTSIIGNSDLSTLLMTYVSRLGGDYYAEGGYYPYYYYVTETYISVDLGQTLTKVAHKEMQSRPFYNPNEDIGGFYFTLWKTDSDLNVIMATGLDWGPTSKPSYYDNVATAAAAAPYSDSGIANIITVPTDEVHADCTSISINGNYHFQSSVEMIADDAFKSCTRLVSITFESDSLLTSIGSGAFANTGLILPVKIPASVTNIRAGAFESASLLKHVDLECAESVLYIDTHAFKGTKYDVGVTTLFDHFLTDLGACRTVRFPPTCSDVDATSGILIFPSWVRLIGNSAFSACAALTSKVEFSGVSELTTIESNSFANCGITSIQIPATTTKIGDMAFGNALSLSTVTYACASTTLFINYHAFKGTPYGVDPIVNNECRNVEFVVDCSDVDDEGHVIVPHFMKTIRATAFQGCIKLKSISFSSGSQLTSIEPSAFAGSGLVSIEIPSGMTSIGELFRGLSSLTTLTFASGSKLASIGPFAFEKTHLTSIEIPATVTVIGEAAFQGILEFGIIAFSSGSQLASIEAFAFKGTMCTSIEIPATVTSIGESAFSGAIALTGVTFASGSQLTSIGMSAFQGTHLSTIEIPAAVTKIDLGAFYDVQTLTTVTFADDSKLTSIEPAAFQGTKLSTIEIPAAVTSIGEGSFKGISSLETVTYECSAGKTLSVINDAFEGTPYGETLAVTACRNVVFQSGGPATLYLFGQSQQCTPFSASNTNSATLNAPTCRIYACPGNSLTLSACDTDGGSCAGDQNFRLFDASNTQIAASDDSCGSCSKIVYSVPSTVACQVYTLNEGCYGNSACSGTVSVISLPLVSRRKLTSAESIATLSRKLENTVWFGSFTPYEDSVVNFGPVFNGADSITACEVGFISVAGNTGCTACPLGFTTSGKGQTICVCGAGYEYTVSTVLAVNVEECSPCASTYYKDQPSNTACLPVPPGYSRSEDGSHISACKAGTYSAGGDEPCLLCSNGKYSATAAATSSSSCIIVPAGSYPTKFAWNGSNNFPPAVTDGAVHTSPCPAGSYSGAGMITCIPCPAGKYAGVVGATSCLLIPPGAESGASSTPPNLQGLGLKDYALCGAGRYRSGTMLGDCVPCNQGAWSTQGASTCEACPVGSTTLNTGSNSALLCTLCGYGYYSSDGTTGTTCTACQNPIFSTVSTATTGVNSDDVCLSVCAAGYYGPACATSCGGLGYTSARGSIAGAGGQASCHCSPGYGFDTDDVTCVKCGTDHYTVDSRCVLIAAGFIRDPNDLDSVIPCNVGTYKSAQGGGSCEYCATGKYSGQTSAVECAFCPKGKYAPLPGMTFCINCSLGKYSTITGATSNVCTDIAAGHFSVDGSNESECPLGTFSKAGNKLANCEPCSSGKYAAATGSFSCTNCSPGKYSPAFGSSSASTCVYAPVGMCRIWYCCACVPVVNVCPLLKIQPSPSILINFFLP